ncbi:MAG: flagellar hook-basal body complex protein FliE [bacterium]|nr:flagellar hook-basal body complex protein FliE [bacterium]
MGPISLDTLMPKSQLIGVKQEPEKVSSSNELVNGFSAILEGHLEEVNDSVNNAGKLTRQLATGEIDNIHSVMIAAQEANIALNFTLALRDKIIRAYEDTLAMGGR